jgi:hypothetical protein
VFSHLSLSALTFSLPFRLGLMLTFTQASLGSDPTSTSQLAGIRGLGHHADPSPASYEDKPIMRASHSRGLTLVTSEKLCYGLNVPLKLTLKFHCHCDHIAGGTFGW